MESQSRRCWGRVARRALVAMFGLLVASPAFADQWSLILNGKAIHLDPPANANYNEKNWGAGFQYDFTSSDGKWIPFVTGSGFIDSNKNPSYYAGGGALRRFQLTGGEQALHVDAGLVAFLMTREGFRHGQPFPGVLPVLSFGTERVSVNMTYIPKVDPKMVAILFFQLKIGLGSGR